MVGAVGQAVVLECLYHPGDAFLRRDAGQRHRQRNVFGGGEARYQMKTLEDEADTLTAYPCLFIGRKRGDIAPFQAVGAGVRPIEQTEQVEQRRLA